MVLYPVALLWSAVHPHQVGLCSVKTLIIHYKFLSDGALDQSQPASHEGQLQGHLSNLIGEHRLRFGNSDKSVSRSSCFRFAAVLSFPALHDALVCMCHGSAWCHTSDHLQQIGQQRMRPGCADAMRDYFMPARFYSRHHLLLEVKYKMVRSSWKQHSSCPQSHTLTLGLSAAPVLWYRRAEQGAVCLQMRVAQGRSRQILRVMGTFQQLAGLQQVPSPGPCLHAQGPLCHASLFVCGD